MKKLLLILLCLPLIFSCGNDKQDNKKKSDDREKTKEQKNNVLKNICKIEADFILTAEELENELKENREKTDEKYQNKIIQLTGGVYSWGSNNGKPTIQLYPTMKIEFQNDSINRITGLNVGYEESDNYMRSLPKHREYSYKTRKSGKGVGNITIKGIYNNGSSVFPKENRRSGDYETDVSNVFINCCIVKE